jgi:DNA-binding CsgD family transcriptional regulator
METHARTALKLPKRGDIARRAFDIVAEIGAVTSLEMLQQTAVKGFVPLGFASFIGFDSVAADGTPAVNILFGKEHGTWEPHYLASDLQQHDPIIKATKTALEPFFWSDALAGKDLDAGEKRVMDEASAFGLHNGFVTPMHNPDGSITAVLLTGERIDPLDPDLRSASHLMSLYFGAMGRRLHRTGLRRRSVRLSPRQLDCLMWVREGKSSTDIGDILGLSARTVDEHVALACARLGVRTRMQAVVEAAAHGLIKL